MKYIKTLDIDIYSTNNELVIAKQGDYESRYIKVIMTENGKVIPLSGLTAYVKARINSDTIACETCQIVDGMVLVELSKAMLSQAGYLELEIMLYDNTGKVTSSTVRVLVQDTISEYPITVTPSFSALSDLINEAYAMTQNAFIPSGTKFIPGCRNAVESSEYSLSEKGIVSIRLNQAFAKGKYTLSGGSNNFKIYRVFTDNTMDATTHTAPYEFDIGTDTTMLEFAFGMPNNDVTNPTTWAFTTASEACLTIVKETNFIVSGEKIPGEDITNSSLTTKQFGDELLTDIGMSKLIHTNNKTVGSTSVGYLVNSTGSFQNVDGNKNYSCVISNCSGHKYMALRYNGFVKNYSSSIGLLSFYNMSESELKADTTLKSPVYTIEFAKTARKGGYFYIKIPDTANTVVFNTYLILSGVTYVNSPDYDLYFDSVVANSADTELDTHIDELAMSSILYGRHITFLGDSITEQNYRTQTEAGGVFNQYSNYIQRRTGCRVTNIAQSSTGFGTTNRKSGANLSPVYYRVEGYAPKGIPKIPTDTDLIVVAHGTNDYGDGKPYPLGNKNDILSSNDLDDSNTVCGFINKFIDTCQSKRPNIPIVFLTPLPRWNSGDISSNGINSQGYTIDDVRDKIIEICKARNIPYLDQRDIPLHPDINYFNQKYYKDYKDPADGLHPNAVAHKLISYNIQSLLEKIMYKDIIQKINSRLDALESR